MHQAALYKSSSEIAIQDATFRELFGSIPYAGQGYVVQDLRDYGWIILYVNFFLQAVSDYINMEYSKVKGHDIFFIGQSADIWLRNDVLDPALKAQLILKLHKCPLSPLVKKYIKYLKSDDPFSFEHCCEVLGLTPGKVRDRINYYKKLKGIYGHNIRIVKNTGKQKVKNMQEKDIMMLVKNGIIKTSDYLKPGLARNYRDEILMKHKVTVVDNEEENIK